MSASVATIPDDLVSTDVLARLLTDPALATKVFPEGPASTPYRVLRHDATVYLQGKRGQWASFHRTQVIEATQHGVAAILDHYWGDGVQLVGYEHSAGPILASFRDQGRRHLVIGLDHPLERGERLAFKVVRMAEHAFERGEEWVETMVDHPIEHLSRTVVFPREHPPRRVWLDGPDGERELPLTPFKHGCMQAHITIPNPRPDTSYTVRWAW